MLSVPAAIITSASPGRMRGRASAGLQAGRAEAVDGDARHAVGQAGQQQPMRATFMPCSASGIAQPVTTSPISARRTSGTLATTSRSTWPACRQGARCAEGTVALGDRRCAPPRRCRRPGSVCSLSVSPSVAQGLAGFQHVRDALLGLLGLEQFDELRVRPRGSTARSRGGWCRLATAQRGGCGLATR